MGLAHPHDGGAEPDATLFPGVVDAARSVTTGKTRPSIRKCPTTPAGTANRPHRHGYTADRAAPALSTSQHCSSSTAQTIPIALATTPTRCRMQTLLAPAGHAFGTLAANNTISNAGSDTSCIIDLRAAPLTGTNAGGFISHDLGVSGGFTIANGVIMDRATGGSGNDLIIGNTVSDNVDGGSGFNIFQIVGARADFTVTGSRASATVAAKAGGITDDLTNVDAVAFAPTPVQLSRHQWCAPRDGRWASGGCAAHSRRHYRSRRNAPAF